MTSWRCPVALERLSRRPYQGKRAHREHATVERKLDVLGIRYSGMSFVPFGQRHGELVAGEVGAQTSGVRRRRTPGDG